MQTRNFLCVNNHLQGLSVDSKSRGQDQASTETIDFFWTSTEEAEMLTISRESSTPFARGCNHSHSLTLRT